MVETFFDVEELIVAVEAVRSVSSLPIVALLTFDDEAETIGGVGAAAAAARLASLDVAAIGTNHGAGLSAALTVLARMDEAQTGLPLAALPNVGLASLAAGRIVFPHSSAEYFSEFATQASALGARIVGGCCGTTPAQIAAIRGGLGTHRTLPRVFDQQEEVQTVAPTAPRDETKLGRALRVGEWVVSIEIDLSRFMKSGRTVSVGLRVKGASSGTSVCSLC